MSEPAQADLTDIYTYIALDNPDAAERFVDDLVRQMYQLAELGLSGSPRDWIRPGLRAFPYRQRCIYSPKPRITRWRRSCATSLAR